MALNLAYLNLTPWPRRWLWLGIAALAIAGLFSVVLVAARTPQLAAFQNLFSVALVVHVDLSVLVWFLAIAGMLLAYGDNARGPRWPLFQPAAFWTTAAATALMALSPLEGEWQVIKSNYIPVLHNIVFLLGLALLMAGMLVALLQGLVTPPSSKPGMEGLLQRSICWSGATLAVSIAFFVATAEMLPSGLPQDFFYETLFWAGGHSLQYLYTLLTMIGWLVLLLAMAPPPSEKARKWLEVMFFLPLLGALSSLPPFFLYDVVSGEFRTFFTQSMIHMMGIAPILFGGYVVARLLRTRPRKENRALYASLVMSLLLFAAGGFIGYLIQGQNVTIPAHYHGSIVGVTLALMGLAYVLLPQFGYTDISRSRLAMWQPILYGGGQLLHIGGLAVSGGYGVLRKTTTGEMAELTPAIKTALGFMGLGGLLAIIGGLLFVVVVIRSAKLAKR